MSSEVKRLLHDVRNPLNNISVNAELGKLTLERTGDTDKAATLFARIVQECRRCDEQLNQLRQALLDESSSDGDKEDNS
jgi:signal transduction histidine kinase